MAGIISFVARQVRNYVRLGGVFAEIIKVQPSLVILDILLSIMMASGRFLADNLIEKLGMKRLLQVSGASGLYLAVLFPYMILPQLLL
jgi:hypothetical protein